MKNNKKIQVNLSKDEHYFTPEEVLILKSKGVDLDALAPEANDGNGKARGGYVKGGDIKDKPTRENSSGNASIDKLIDEAYSNPNITAATLKTTLEKIKYLAGIDKNTEALNTVGVNNISKEIKKFSKYINHKEQSETENVRNDLYQKKLDSKIAEARKAGVEEADIEKIKNDLIKNKNVKNPSALKQSLQDIDNVFNGVPLNNKGAIPAAKEKFASKEDSFLEDDNKENSKKFIKTADDLVNKYYTLKKDVEKNPKNYTTEQIKQIDDKYINAVRVKGNISSAIKNGYYDELNTAIYDDIKSIDNDVNLKPFTYDSSDKKQSVVNNTNQNTSTISPLIKGATMLAAHDKPKIVDNGKGPNKTVQQGDAQTAKVEPSTKPSTIPTKKSALSTQVDNELKLNNGVPLATDKTTNPFDTEVPESSTKDTFVNSYANGNLADKQKALDVAAKEKNPYLGKDKNTPPATDPGTEKKKDAEQKQAFDLTKGLSAIQFGLGVLDAQQLGSLKPDTIPNDFLAVGNDLKRESSFGMSPLAMEQAKNAIELNRRMQVKNVLGQAGGDAGVALGNMGAAGLEADNAVSDLAARSEEMRYAKLLGYKDFMKDKMAASNRIYDKYENRFKEMEMADANLIGSGVKNLIEGDRYDKVLAAQKDRDKISNSNTFTIV